MAIEKSYIVEQERFEAISGLKIDPRILLVAPQGHRLIVMVNPPPEMYGEIILPQQWRAVEKAGSSWVVSCGPLVGAGCPHPGSPAIENPGDLLYAQVLHGEWVGKPIRHDLLESTSTKSPYLIMTDRDLWAIDFNPKE
jgi:hypothetical protein